jgi:hypothetical protein
LELLRPFYALLDRPWKRGCAAEQTYEWEAAHPEIAASSDYIMGYYGTGGVVDLGTLAEMFRYYSDLDEIVPDPSLTFGELLADLVTRPMGYPGSVRYLGRFGVGSSWERMDINGRFLSPIEVILWECFGWRSDVLLGEKPMVGDREYGDLSWNDFAPIRDMRVVEWARELERLCRWKSFDREETWT